MIGIMTENFSRLYFKILLGLLSGIILILAIVFRETIWENTIYLYDLLMDRDRIRDFIVSFGWGAPLVFTWQRHASVSSLYRGHRRLLGSSKALLGLE